MPEDSRMNETTGSLQNHINPPEAKSRNVDPNEESSVPQQLLVPRHLVQDKNTFDDHVLLKKYQFDKLRSNSKVALEPGVVHFGGFKIDKEHKQRIFVRNISDRAIRVAIILPTTKFFIVDCKKKGMLAPGSAEELEVYFRPKEWKYYYDSIEVFTGQEDENLIIPLHAYPASNDMEIPSIVDFGTIGLATSKTKIIPLHCKIPIDFEYEIKIIQGDSAFEVGPLKGVILAESVHNISITYLPNRFKTSEMKISIEIAQFDSKPVIVKIMGNCLPNQSKEETLKMGMREYRKVLHERSKENLENRVDTLLERKFDPFVDKPFIKEEIEKFEVVDDIKIPLAEHYGQAHTNFVMNSVKGKMPLQDLAKFIKEQRELINETQRKAEKGEVEEEPLVETAQDLQAKELRFDMQYRDLEEQGFEIQNNVVNDLQKLYDRGKELKGTQIFHGEVPPTIQEKKAVINQREKFQDRLLKNELSKDVNRFQTEYPEDVNVSVPEGYVAQGTPCWDPYKNDLFAYRLQVIDRFVRVATKQLIRCRGDKRISQLKQAMQENNVVDRQSCKLWVESENKAAAFAGGSSSSSSSSKNGNSSIPQVTLHPDMILPTILPTLESPLGGGEEKVPFDFEPLSNFIEYEPIDLGFNSEQDGEKYGREDWKVFGYEQLEVPPPGTFMRENKGRRSPKYGCYEEYYVRGPRGPYDDGAEEVLFHMPDECLFCKEHDPLKMIIPDPKIRTWVGQPTDYHECDLEYILGVEELAPIRDFQDCWMNEPLTLEAESIEICGSNFPQWHDIYRENRQLHDPFQDFDPIPPSTLLGGGQYGPAIQGDLKGERYKFMPVEKPVPGDRDLPSDTDSDGRDETFMMPKPNISDYLKDWYAPEVVEKATDIWKKRVEEWESLQARAAKIKSSSFADREDAREARKKLLDLRKPQSAPLMPEYDYELGLGEKALRQKYLEDLLEIRSQERARRMRRCLHEVNKMMEPHMKLFVG